MSNLGDPSTKRNLSRSVILGTTWLAFWVLLGTVGFAQLALLPSDADNVYLAITARELNPDIQIIARASDEKAEVGLKRSGAADTLVALGDEDSLAKLRDACRA